MKNLKTIMLLTATVVAGYTTCAYCADNDKFALKAHANIGLGNAVDMSSSMTDIDKSSSSNSYGVDFGWTFWQKQNHSFELNLGVSYNTTSVELGLSALNYYYAAGADADMDGDRYTRCYEVSSLRLKSQLGRLEIPVYLSYGYRCNNWLKFHADLGLAFGFNLSSKICDTSGSGNSYGVYQKYDDLKFVNASYLNDFGPAEYSSTMVTEANTNSINIGLLTGIGAEFRVSHHIAIDLGIRYNIGFSDLYKSGFTKIDLFNEANAPITYKVANGQQIKSLTDYLTKSKLSNLGLNISLIYRF